MYIVVGLGNPGRKFMFTRHNVGFDVVDLLAKRHNIMVDNKSFDGLTGMGDIGGQKVVLLKPLTYMNLSGISVSQAVEYYKVGVDRLLVVYDDVDLQIGQLRIRKSGSAGTHNGMKSVIYHLQRDDFPRIRVGIGKPDPGEDLAHYVLDRFTREEREKINQAIQRAVQAIETVLQEGIDKAMELYNRRY